MGKTSAGQNSWPAVVAPAVQSIICSDGGSKKHDEFFSFLGNKVKLQFSEGLKTNQKLV